MCDLSDGMNAGVGPAGSVDDHAVPDYLRKRIFQSVLYCAAVGLALPSIEGGSVVGDLETKANLAFRGGILGPWGRVQGARKLWESSQP